MSRKQSSSAPAASYAIALSTGSPASRRLTKLTPLTTRPSFTSRQGMTRDLSMRAVLDQRQCFRRIEAAIIERAAGDRAGQAHTIGFEQPLDIGDRGKAARRDHRDRSRLR